MRKVTRTLKNGGDTGTLNRDEVRAVTAAIAEGRTADVLSGAVLKQFRAARKRKASTGYDVALKDLGIKQVAITADTDRSVTRDFSSGRKDRSIAKRGSGPDRGKS